MGRIYHYTKISTLAIILETHSIRLNALKNMDDLLEGKSLDDFDFSNYYYASSWTRDNKESIPMWNMYTDKMRGIRIEVDENFLEVDEDENDYHIRNCVANDILAFKINGGEREKFLTNVEYSDIKPRFLTGHPRGYISDDYYNIGRIKPIVWEFQNEVRFRLQGISKNRIVNFGDTLFDKYINAVINNVPNETEHIDVIFDINKWINANFVLGPDTSAEDLENVKRLIEKYLVNFSGVIEKSHLKIRFK